MTLLDLVLKVVAWGVGGVCMHDELFISRERRLPFFFRGWCVLYLFVSGYCFIVNIVLYEKHAALPIQCLGSDVSSVISLIKKTFFCVLWLLEFSSRGLVIMHDCELFLELL